MRKLDHDQKRLEIAEAAARIIARSGMEGLTTRNLANAIHGSIGAVHHYFNSKDEIVLAAFDWANQSVIARLQKYLEHGASFDDMLRVIEAALPHDAQTRIEWRVRLALWNHAATNSDAGKLLRANIRTHRNALAEVARARYPLFFSMARKPRPSGPGQRLVGSHAWGLLGIAASLLVQEQ